MATMKDWSELPGDMIQNVASRLERCDVIRFRSVCSSWHSTVPPSRPSEELCLYLLPFTRLPCCVQRITTLRLSTKRGAGDKDQDDNISVYDIVVDVEEISPGKFRLWKHMDPWIQMFWSEHSAQLPFPLPMMNTKGKHSPRKSRLWEYIDSWIEKIWMNHSTQLPIPYRDVIDDSESKGKISTGKVWLWEYMDPWIKRLWKQHSPEPPCPRGVIDVSEFRVSEAVLVNLNNINDDEIEDVTCRPMFVVIMVHNPLSIFRSDVRSWTHFGEEGWVFCDVVKFGKEVFVVGFDGRLAVLDIVDPSMPSLRVMVPNPLPHVINGDKKRLVPLGDKELLLIDMYRDACVYPNPVGLKVYNWDKGRGVWDEEVISLRDKIIFLSEYSSSYVYASEFPGCRGNRIVFFFGPCMSEPYIHLPDDEMEVYFRHCLNEDYDGKSWIYDLEDGTITSFDQLGDHKFFYLAYINSCYRQTYVPPPIW